ncbi:hypothetical protein PHLCEN_2v5496 [Hermanssonia centrifuga]|uniref:Uncharacterized protein n=1 Tax=Hermanssonia centrifuga TaxID=98765 RepID=A0A2R6P297_9APHY|nr:hypothetical protein PHLCEN_2v5496 [Hermanssonia centrifuga]
MREFIFDELDVLLQWDTARANDFRGLTGALYIMDKSSNTMPTIQALTNWLEDSIEVSHRFRKDAAVVFKIFVVLAQQEKYRDCFNLVDSKSGKALKVSPAEFIMSSVLIYHHKDKLSLAQLSEAIRKMRLDIRKVEVDIRANSRVVKHMLAFIKNVKSSQLKAASGECAAIAAEKLHKPKASTAEADDDEVQVEIKPTQKASKKRARKDEDEDEYVEPVDVSSKSQHHRPSTRVKFSSPPADALVPSHSTVPSPISSTNMPPPPYPPHIHPDRLAAMRAAKSTVPPSHPSGQSPLYRPSRMTASQAWESQDIDMHSMNPRALASTPHHLEQSLMSRIIQVKKAILKVGVINMEE